MTFGSDVEEEIDALARLDLAGLQEAWRERYGPPPAFRSRDLLRRLLAFEIQAEIYGGLDAELRQRLRRSHSTARKKPGLQPGTTITREWRGERHVVEVVEAGFLHAGTRYRSLSEVARAITGARWSGPRFFGLAEGAPK
ncbi:MAG: DUF2924 domain-containing protein [Rhizorhabdus sp.]|uniref:DUF2924 domain-containing protein n=1 Tax=Rhizorhabdus sp. TaxID=1968843 RepID=UPI001B655D1E|nr:DUF2924 domain-containing protein [Rhizorhabdus sp.]MBP8235905.1 DUF2924 domain-containing protein [Rhizorhabdus sp.]